MIADVLADLEPFDRLKHVLVAMPILAEPDENGPIAGFVQECQYRLPERSVDPLAALAAGLTERLHRVRSENGRMAFEVESQVGDSQAFRDAESGLRIWSQK